MHQQTSASIIHWQPSINIIIAALLCKGRQSEKGGHRSSCHASCDAMGLDHPCLTGHAARHAKRHLVSERQIEIKKKFAGSLLLQRSLPNGRAPGQTIRSATETDGTVLKTVEMCLRAELCTQRVGANDVEP
mmetsp:Transcript_91181/g.199723  ORF Transcript_91181/g.199723 Transcript_91181/m.199723 type:complete len:132 (-) Transcript_91181:157-552(-)